MREATQTVSSCERKLFIIGHSPVAFVSGGSHTSGSRASRSRRQARSGGELFPRAAIVADFATCHPSTSMVVFGKPMNWIQNLVRSTGGFHRRHSCAFGPSRHKLPRSRRSCEPPQPSGEFQGSCEWGGVMSGGEKMRRLLCALFVLTLALGLAAPGWGQSQITAGTVQGDVVDEKGGSVAGAIVEAKNLATNFVQTDTTNTDGHFAFLSLAPGRYTLIISKPGFATILQQNVNLTVGQTITIPATMKVSSVAQQIVVTDVPIIETTKTESSSTLNELAVSATPVLGRKFEDLLTLTPGVSISQGPDGDEINFNGQRGVFNNVSLDGGDYNNGFFGEQLGGQRAAIDITLDAVKEFQVVASGANAEFGRTAGGVVNVITKSGTNEIHGSGFEYFRTESLSANTSDGKPLQDFRRNQFGGSLGGPIYKDKLFFFGAAEGIRENLTRQNLSAAIGTPCGSSIAFDGTPATDAKILASPDCQRVALLNFMQSTFNEKDGAPVNHAIRNGAAFGRIDYNLNDKNQIFGSYNYDYSKNSNQTFDVPAYGTTANGIEGPSKIQAINTNWFSTISGTKLNEAHFTYARENRPRNATDPTSVPDTNIGSASSPTAFAFRFGQPFFLEPTID